MLKHILVTGGTSGIGLALCKLLIRDHGCYVYLGSIDQTNGATALKKILQEVPDKWNQIEVVQIDVLDDQSCVSAAKTLKDKGVKLYALVNNAGITKDNLLMRMGEEDFDNIIEVNLKSVFNMTKAVQRIFLKKRSGSIINMSSVVGIKGNAGQSNYAASKAGIIGFSKSIALELGSRNIRSNVIAPGFIETEMTAKLDEKTVDVWRNAIPLKRGGSPEDIANACVFLASDLSAYVTGQTLNVDGGMLT